MKVKNITLVITDPCYIKNSYSATRYINESTIYGDWSRMCYKGHKNEVKKKIKEWDKFYFKMESNKKDSKSRRILFNDSKRGLYL